VKTLIQRILISSIYPFARERTSFTAQIFVPALCSQSPARAQSCDISGSCSRRGGVEGEARQPATIGDNGADGAEQVARGQAHL
jgi:hypothetical protein